MISLELEQALRRVEEATEALSTVEAADLMALCRALDDRADAITQLALIAGSAPPENGNSTLERMAAVLARGEEATHRLVRTRQETAEDSTRLRRIASSLGEGSSPAPELECEG